MVGSYYGRNKETGKFVEVYDLDRCLESIKIRFQDNEREIERLLEENVKLKDELYKNSEKHLEEK